MTNDTSEMLEFERLKLDLSSRKLIVADSTIILRNKEFTLLEYFLKNTNRVITRTQILEDVWDRNIFCSTNTVDVHVSKLRKILKQYLEHNPIRTVPCIGYIVDSY